MKYYKNNFNSEKKKLTDEEIRLVEHTYRDYKRLGLTSKNNDKIEEMKKSLSEVCTKFSKNLNEENTHFMMSKEDLDGLPESWFKSTCKIKANLIYILNIQIIIQL